MIEFNFKRGAPVSFGFRVLSGDPTGLDARMWLKPAPDHTIPPEATETVAEFELEFTAAAGDVPAQWLCSIDAETADELPRGRYVTDARLALDDEPVAVTGEVYIVLSESVSG